MCGIAGIFEFGEKAQVDSGVLRRMCAAMAHRGPDDDGFFTQGGSASACAASASSTSPPDTSPSATKTVRSGLFSTVKSTIIASLRENLTLAGHRYRTHSDTETIVHLYEEYGHDCVQHLRGMFAFAIWDAKRNRLFIARDRLGIKPLYYRLTPQQFHFRLRNQSHSGLSRSAPPSSIVPFFPSISPSDISRARKLSTTEFAS